MANNQSCNSAYSNNGTHMIYSWVLNSKKSVQPQSHLKIIRNSGIEIIFSCAILLGKSEKLINFFLKTFLESKVSSGEIKVLLDSKEIVLAAALTSFSAEMGIYSDSSFSSLKDASIPIKIPD